MSNFSIKYKIVLNMQQFAQNMKRVNKLAKKNKLIMRSMSKDIQKYKGDFARFSLAGVAAFTGMTIAATKFEAGLSNVFTLLDKPQIDKFGKDLELAAENAIRMGFSMEDTNKALFDTISALGLSDASMKAFQTAQKLSIGGDAKLSASVLGLAKIMNVYGRETTDSTRVANALFSAQKVGTTTVQELALNVGKIAGQSKMAGLSYEEMLSSLAVLTNVMRNTEEAGTAMAAVLKAVTKPGKQQKEIMDELGITYGISGIRAVGFSTVLKQVSDAMNINADAVANAIPEIRALRGVANLSEESIRLMDETVIMINRDIKEGTGLNRAYNDQMKIVNRRFKMASGDIKIMAKRFGKELLPTVIILLKVLSKMLGFLIDLPSPIKKLILVVGGLATVFSILMVGIASFLAVKVFLIAALSILTKGFIVMWAAALGPIGLIIIGITALAVAGVILYKKWKPLRDLINSIFLMGTFSKVQKFLVGEEVKLAGTKYSRDINELLLGKGEFSANINVNAPEGAVRSVETREKTTGMMRMNLGLNMQEA